MSYLRPAIIALLAGLALLPAAPARAQDATGQIAFTSDRDGNSEIYVMDADGSNQTRLTNNPANDAGPTWSPDGTKIAFTSNRDDPNLSTCSSSFPFCETQIYVMDADGSNQTRITNVPGEGASGPAWSHDSSRIAFAAIRQGIPSISTMNPDGSGVTRVTDNPPDSFLESDSNPAWSPDDLQLVFEGLPRSRIGFTSIFKINVDGTGLIKFSPPEPGLLEGDPTWSPDGSRIAFTSNRDDLLGVSARSVYVMNADGGAPIRLTNNQANDRGPAWSTDGTQIAFASDRDGNSEIYVMNADGSGQTNLTNNPAADSDPVWSPQAITPAQETGGQIAFTRGPFGSSDIYVMNADGSNQTNLTNNPAADSDPAWSPDGSRIAFISDRDGNSEIFVMNADGSNQTNLTNSPAAESTPAWSPDGSRIAFTRDFGGIYVMNADGSNQTELIVDGSNQTELILGGASHPAWSPDGSRIAFDLIIAPTGDPVRRTRPHIYVMNADGSNLALLTVPDPDSNYLAPAWSPDGERIAFFSDVSFNAGIYVMNADGSGRALLAEEVFFGTAPTWSPDGTQIAFASFRDGNNDIYVMNADGSGQTNLTNNPARDFDPVWSPQAIAEPTPTLEPVAPTGEPEPVEPTAEPLAREDTGPPQSEFVDSVPGPNEISTDPEVIGSNIALTLFVIFTFAFTSALFNQTLSSNRREIEGWVGRFFAPFRGLSGIVEQGYGAVAERRPWIQRVAGPAVILGLTGLIYGFLSPDFGFNTRSVVLFLALVAGVGAVTYVYAGGEALFTNRRFGLQAGVRLYAVALAIAAGSVLVSRLMDFQPGFLFGFVASYTLLATGALDRRQAGQAALFAVIALLALSLIAWFLVIPLRDLRQESSAWWWGLPEGAAVAVFVAGLQGVFFSMIPLSFMDGAKIAQWNRLLWLLVFGAAGFLFWHVLLNQEGTFLEALEQRKVRAALILLSVYSVVTLATWAYFRGRVYEWSMPSLPWKQSVPVPGVRRGPPVFMVAIALAGAAIIAIGFIAFALRGDDGAESPPGVAVAGTPTVATLASPTPPTPTIAATPTSTTIDRSTCGQPSELAELAQELAIIRDKGYIVCDTSTFLPGGAIHVLIGVLEDSSDSFTQWAFFFVGGEYLGTDSITTSVSISVVSQTPGTVTLSYAMFRPDDQACCPSAGEAIVPYDWDGTRLTPRVDIPPTDGPISRR